MSIFPHHLNQNNFNISQDLLIKSTQSGVMRKSNNSKEKDCVES